MIYYKQCPQCFGKKQIRSFDLELLDCSLCEGKGQIVDQALMATQGKSLEATENVARETTVKPKRARKTKHTFGKCVSVQSQTA